MAIMPLQVIEGHQFCQFGTNRKPIHDYRSHTISKLLQIIDQILAFDTEVPLFSIVVGTERINSQKNQKYSDKRLVTV